MSIYDHIDDLSGDSENKKPKESLPGIPESNDQLLPAIPEPPKARVEADPEVLDISGQGPAETPKEHEPLAISDAELIERQAGPEKLARPRKRRIIIFALVGIVGLFLALSLAGGKKGRDAINTLTAPETYAPVVPTGPTTTSAAVTTTSGGGPLETNGSTSTSAKNPQTGQDQAAQLLDKAENFLKIEAHNHKLPTDSQAIAVILSKKLSVPASDTSTQPDTLNVLYIPSSNTVFLTYQGKSDVPVIRSVNLAK